MGVHSVLMRLFSIYSIFLVVYIPTVIKKSGVVVSGYIHAIGRHWVFMFSVLLVRSVLSFYTQNLWFWFPLRFSAIFFGLRFLVFMSKRGVLLVFDLDLNPRRLFFSFFFLYFSFSFSLFCFIFNFFSALY